MTDHTTNRQHVTLSVEDLNQLDAPTLRDICRQLWNHVAEHRGKIAKQRKIIATLEHRLGLEGKTYEALNDSQRP